MSESAVWGSSRLAAALLVIALHLGAIAWLLTVTRASTVLVSTGPAFELLLLPPAKAPKMLADSAPKHLLADVGISVAPPVLDGFAPAAPATQADGEGAGVNWTAEAQRALEAFEIRRAQNVQHSALGLSPWDGWLPERQLRAGGRIRTESGDWVVWINGSCYQIARWNEGAPVKNASEPRTICVNARIPPPGDAR